MGHRHFCAPIWNSFYETRTDHGNVVITADGQVTYTSDVGFLGTDSFKIWVSDGQRSASAVIVVTVSPGNAAPTAHPAQIEAVSGQQEVVSVSGSDAD